MIEYLVLFKAHSAISETTGQYIILKAENIKECLAKWYEILCGQMSKNVKTALERYEIKDQNSLKTLINFINSISKYDKIVQIIDMNLFAREYDNEK